MSTPVYTKIDKVDSRRGYQYTYTDGHRVSTFVRYPNESDSVYEARFQSRMSDARSRNARATTKADRRYESNVRGAERLNRNKDVVMSVLSDVANSTPFSGDEVVKAAEEQRQEKLNKWHDIKTGMDAGMTAAEALAAGYGVIRGLAHVRRSLARAATRSSGQPVTRAAMDNLATWNRRVDAIDKPQVLMNGVGGVADAYQWITANNSFDSWENGLETGSNAAGVIGGMNWFRNLPFARRIGNSLDAILDGLGYSAATWDVIKNLPPLSGALDNIRDQTVKRSLENAGK